MKDILSLGRATDASVCGRVFPALGIKNLLLKAEGEHSFSTPPARSYGVSRIVRRRILTRFETPGGRNRQRGGSIDLGD